MNANLGKCSPDYEGLCFSSAGSIIIFNSIKTFKNYGEPRTPSWGYKLVKDYGPAKITYDQSWGHINYTYYDLVYAKIDGVEYGKLATNINDEILIPSHYSISQNYPNPFNPATTINYSIPKSSHVSIVIYNLLGEEIEKLVDEVKSAGNYKIIFNGENLSSGIYYYQIKAGEYLETNKMVLTK